MRAERGKNHSGRENLEQRERHISAYNSHNHFMRWEQVSHFIIEETEASRGCVTTDPTHPAGVHDPERTPTPCIYSPQSLAPEP